MRRSSLSGSLVDVTWPPPRSRLSSLCYTVTLMRRIGDVAPLTTAPLRKLARSRAPGFCEGDRSPYFSDCAGRGFTHRRPSRRFFFPFSDVRHPLPSRLHEADFPFLHEAEADASSVRFRSKSPKFGPIVTCAFLYTFSTTRQTRCGASSRAGSLRQRGRCRSGGTGVSAFCRRIRSRPFQPNIVARRVDRPH